MWTTKISSISQGGLDKGFYGTSECSDVLNKVNQYIQKSNIKYDKELDKYKQRSIKFKVFIENIDIILRLYEDEWRSLEFIAK